MSRSKLRVSLGVFSRICRKCSIHLQVPLFIVIFRYQLFPFFKSLTDVGSFFENSDDKVLKYWLKKTDTQIVAEADTLYNEKKYLEVYELLNRLRFSSNVEVHWRIGRALYRLSLEKSIKSELLVEMLKEAYELLRGAIELGEQNANVHKWFALIYDRYNTIQGLEYRIKNSETVKQHIVRACELNPDDIGIQYMLGRWCYEMTHMSILQRFIARLFYTEPPKSTYEEAYRYLSNVEELRPGKILANTYLLGQTCIMLGEFYRAQYYLNLVANLQPKDEYEKQCVSEAVKQSKRLKQYELGKGVLFSDFPFAFGE